MFDRKEIEAYRSISAPENLRERVLLSCAEQKPVRRNFSGMIRTASSVAACLVLVIVLTVYTVGNFGDASVTVSGNAILPQSAIEVSPEFSVAPLSAQPIGKSISQLAFPITLELSERTEITVSDGLMCMTCSADSSEKTGTVLTAKGDVLIIWNIEPSAQNDAFVMTLRGALKSETLILSYDEVGNVWTILRERG